jgi:stage IV sporulation protein B
MKAAVPNMSKKTAKISLISLWSLTLALICCLGLFDFLVPERLVIGEDSVLPSYPCIAYAQEGDEVSDGLGKISTVKARLFGVVTLKEITLKKYEDVCLIPGGMTLGVKLLGDGVVVVGVGSVETSERECSPAADAGLQPKDVILKVNGTAVKTVSALTAAIEGSHGKALSLVCRRDSKEFTATLTPVCAKNDGKYKSGMWVKDVSSGIGTVTYIDPKTGAFGALGHGICDKDSGALAPSGRGVVTDAVVTGVIKGQKGTPGELRGYLKSNKKGTLLKNTECGVFGVFTEYKGEAIPIALSDKVHKGKATLRTMLDDGSPMDYEVEITEIKRGTTKSFTVRVTDERLLEKTGGIVQGMSGSPIIQDGKLIGAVTHVMVNDPTAGYGIFIENMLNAAQMPMAKAS